MEKQSYYKEVPEVNSFLKSTINIEELNTEILVDNLLNEFINSSVQQKDIYRPILLKWLSQMDESVLENEDEQKVRDLIYEMF